MQAFGRGVLCNWLVCLAVWQAAAAQTLGGKAIAVWFPISAFVAMGLEVWAISGGIAVAVPIHAGLMALLAPMQLCCIHHHSTAL